MTKASKLHKSLLIPGVLAILFGAIIFSFEPSHFIKYNSLGIAVTIDLLVTIPLVYFLLIRKTSIPNTTVVPILILGLAVGYYVLPQEKQSYLDLFKIWALPVIELSVITFIVLKVRKALNSYNQIKNTTSDFFTALKETCVEIVPRKIVTPLATEIAVIYYGFVNWKSRPLRQNEFTHHQNSSSFGLFIGLILIISAETVGLHFLIGRWSPTAAWVLTGLSAYTALQVWGFARSLSQRPIAIVNKTIVLRYGILNEAMINVDHIESIELSQKELEKDKLTRSLSPLGELESHNTIIRLKAECTLFGLYGSKKKFKVLRLHVDEAGSFKTTVDNLID